MNAPGRDGVTAPIDVMIVGAPKAGTTSLARYLASHPEICSHPQRECNYFVDSREHAAGWPAACSRYLGRCAGERRLAKSAPLMYHEDAVRRLREHNDRVLVVCVLRDPVERAYSEYWFARRSGWEDIEDFERAFHAPADRFSSDWVRREGTRYLERGMYSRAIDRIYRTFDESRVVVLLVEDLRRPATYARLFRAVDVDDGFVPDLVRRHNVRTAARSRWLARAIARNWGVKRIARRYLPGALLDRAVAGAKRLNSRSFTPPPLSSDVRARLVEIYRPYNDALAERIGRDLAHWNRPGPR